MSVHIDASGIQDLDQYFERFPRVASEAMSIALNDTARDVALPAARRDITKEVAFPEGYLDDGRRLSITQYATPTQLEVRVTGRDRPTSLARFVPYGTRVVRGGDKSNPGLTVTVKPGSSHRFASGFLIGLRNGNIGFAIRLRPGDTVRGVQRFQPIQLFPGVFLLYGPSVNQIFGDIADQITPEVTSALESEFMRQFVRLSGADQ